ncbi:MAG TPA: hypothetical protein VN918_06710 [Myxococcaceae bacterium]|nr:hypothetical protein [Myxococcaceae bacterium]
MRKVVQVVAVVGVLAWMPLHAQAARAGQGWSVLTGQTVGDNATAVHVQAGWPGISATLLHGYTPTVDLGGIFTFNYGVEGDVNSVYPGLKLQGYAKATLMETPKYNLGVWFAPGPLLYFFPSSPFYSSTVFGITFASGLIFGLPVTNVVNVAFNFDLPMYVTFGTIGKFTVPILFGGGVEYFLEKNMALTFNLRMGPVIYTGTPSATNFDLMALFGLAFKI